MRPFNDLDGRRTVIDGTDRWSASAPGGGSHVRFSSPFRACQQRFHLYAWLRCHRGSREVHGLGKGESAEPCCGPSDPAKGHRPRAGVPPKTWTPARTGPPGRRRHVLLGRLPDERAPPPYVGAKGVPRSPGATTRWAYRPIRARAGAEHPSGVPGRRARWRGVRRRRVGERPGSLDRKSGPQCDADRSFEPGRGGRCALRPTKTLWQTGRGRCPGPPAMPSAAPAGTCWTPASSSSAAEARVAARVSGPRSGSIGRFHPAWVRQLRPTSRPPDNGAVQQGSPLPGRVPLRRENGTPRTRCRPRWPSRRNSLPRRRQPGRGRPPPGPGGSSRNSG